MYCPPMRVALSTGTTSSALAHEEPAIKADIAISNLLCGLPVSKSFLPLKGVSRDQARVDERLRDHDEVDLPAAELRRRDDRLEIPFEQRALELRPAGLAGEVGGRG